MSATHAGQRWRAQRVLVIGESEPIAIAPPGLYWQHVAISQPCSLNVLKWCAFPCILVERNIDINISLTAPEVRKFCMYSSVYRLELALLPTGPAQHRGCRLCRSKLWNGRGKHLREQDHWSRLLGLLPQWIFRPPDEIWICWWAWQDQGDKAKKIKETIDSQTLLVLSESRTYHSDTI